MSAARFSHADGVYALDYPDQQVTLTLSQVVRSKDGLTGTLKVTTSLTFVPTTRGVVTIGKINLLAPTTLASWAKSLADAFNTTTDDVTLPWRTWLQELSVQVSEVLAAGPPPVLLSEGGVPAPLSITTLPGGLVALNRLPMIICGDGEVGKSTLALWMAGHLTAHGHRVLYVDWETDQDLAQLTLWRLFTPEVPQVYYYGARAGGAIWDQREAIKAQMKLLGITYVICDSVLPAISGSDGPESAASVSRYFAEVGALGPVGSLHLAHVTKATREDETKRTRATALGSVFWQNLSRIGYFADSDDDGSVSTRTVALYRNKGGALAKRVVHDLALDFRYDDTVPDGTGHIDVVPADLLANPTLAGRVSFGRRIYAYLRTATRTTPEVAEHLYGDTEPETLTKARGLLHKLAKAGKVVNIDQGATGRGVVGRWANVDQVHQP